jgi:hypothetical protein
MNGRHEGKGMTLSRRTLFLSLSLSICGATLGAQVLNLPPRPASAPTGSAFAATIAGLALQEREEAIFVQIASGNVPDFLRTLVPVTVSATIDGRAHTATYYVAPDYLAVGSNDDYILMPMTPALAQRIASRLACNLPTPKMVDDIYSAAAVKLRPQPIPPTPAMTSVPVFVQHNDSLTPLRKEQLAAHPLGALVAGHKKDVVITSLINNPAPTGKVAIYGWHQLNGVPIQPLYTGHVDWWADYSHGIRLVQRAMTADGAATTLAAVLDDPGLAALLSNQGRIPNTVYPIPPV